MHSRHVCQQDVTISEQFFGLTFYQRQHVIKMGDSFSGCVPAFEESHQSPLWADLDKDFERSESTDGPEMDVPSGTFLGSKA